MARPTPLVPRPGALLLTGGASRRMGRDKATLLVGGVELANRTAALLLQVADPVIEVGPGYTSLPRTREEPPGSGPLAAVAAGAAALPAGRPALVVATDLPRLTPRLLERLARHPAPTADYAVVPRDRTGRAQPLCARYSPAALALAQELVAAGHRAMKDLLALLLVIPLEADGADETAIGGALCDVDTPADLSAVMETHP